MTAAEPFTEMAALIAHNDESRFAGAVVVVPPGGGSQFPRSCLIRIRISCSSGRPWRRWWCYARPRRCRRRRIRHAGMDGRDEIDPHPCGNGARPDRPAEARSAGVADRRDGALLGRSEGEAVAKKGWSSRDFCLKALGLRPRSRRSARALKSSAIT